MDDHASSPAETVKPTLTQILFSFSLISLYGFGGVLAWSRRMLVEERKWMTPAAFNDVFAMCQFLPGPNIVNLSVIFGSRVHGAAGSVMALTGLLCPPVTIVSVLAVLYGRYGDIPAIGHALYGVVSAAAGLLIATVLKMAGPVVRNWRNPGLLVGAAAFVAIGPLAWPLPEVVAVAVPVSFALAWWMRLRR